MANSKAYAVLNRGNDSLSLSGPGIDADTYPCDIIGPMYYEDVVLAEPLPISDGSAKAHDRPGLGVG